MTCYSPGISLWFLIWFLGWTEAPESASSFDQQLQSVNMYASIKNMRSFQERPKSFFLAKCLSSLYGIGTVRYKTPSSKLILNGDCVYSAKTWSCEVVGCHQISECNHILCCVWEAPLFWLLIQHLMASGTFFEFAVVNLLGLRTILVLPLTRFLLLKLYWQVATTVLPSRACHFAQLDPDLYSKCSCPRTICKFGTASYQMPSSKLVLNGDCAVQKSDVAKL